MSNYRGPLEVELVDVPDPDGWKDELGRPLIERRALRIFATTNPGGERVEVELRAGRGGVVFIQALADLEPVEAPDDLPSPAALHPANPAARVTPFSIDDFGPAVVEEEMTDEERQELEELTRAEAADEAARAAAEAAERTRAQVQ